MILCGIILGIVIFSSCFVSTAFIDPYVVSKWIAFGFSTCFASILVIIFLCKGEHGPPLDIKETSIFISVVAVIELILCHGNAYGNDLYLFNIFVLFCVVCKIISIFITITQIIAIAYIISAQIDSIYVLWNWWTVRDTLSLYGDVVGHTFLLTLGLISLIYFIKLHNRNKKLMILMSVMFFLFLILIYISNSRTALLSLVFSGLCYLKNKRLYLILTAIALIIGITLYREDKNESTKGRIFILYTSITLLNSPERCIWGYGEDGFLKNYMQQQSSVLNECDEKTHQLADNIIHPLNEIILISVKYGVIASLILILLVILLLRSKRIPRFSKSILIVLIIYSMFSYPFRYPVAWIALSTVIASWNHLHRKNLIASGKYPLLLSVACFSIIVLGMTYVDFDNMSKWKKAYSYSLMGREKKACDLYLQLSGHFKVPDFVYNYASYLYYQGKFKEALSVINQIHSDDYEVALIKGQILKNLGRNHDAIMHFESASAMCPNRFNPLFEIYNIHKKLGNRSSQLEYKNIILNKPIKIESSRIDYIRKSISEDYEENV